MVIKKRAESIQNGSLIGKEINRFISVHIPKTGGTIFRRRILYENFKLVKMDYHPHPLENYSVIYNLKEYNIIHGHFRASKYFDSNLPYIVWLRDPIKRIISDYNFNVLKLCKKKVNFDTFIETETNIMSKYMNIPRKNFVFVGIIEKWSDSIMRFGEMFGKDLTQYCEKEFLDSIKNTYDKSKRNYFQATPSQVRRMIDLNEEDIELYNDERSKYA